ncbi:integral membrane protein [Microbacterium sp. HM58-2]|nr:integral membrane protein [Microbacterium sp. HM58-2]
MSAPVHAVTRYKVGIGASVEAKVEGELSFTDAEVREWAGIEDDGEALDPELIDEYARERIGEEGDLTVVDVTWWNKTDVTVIGTERVMHVPAGFVPLPGMEGTL